MLREELRLERRVPGAPRLMGVEPVPVEMETLRPDAAAREALMGTGRRLGAGFGLGGGVTLVLDSARPQALQ